LPIQPFHLAVPVHDLKEAEKFYSEILDLEKGRSSDLWVDFNFYGHQFVIHEVKNYQPQNNFNSVDQNDVPVPHFGVVLIWDQFWELSQSLENHNIKFQIEPHIRFEGKTGEQATMFFYDPSGNALELKAFRNPDELFKS
jgi:extradiol dioxygenase family protein